MLNNKELQLPWEVRRLKPGQRICFNAMYTLNLSLKNYRDKCVPMTDEVSHVLTDGPGGSVLVETISKTLIRFPKPSICVQLLKKKEDTYSYQEQQWAETHNGISIE